MMRRLRPNTIAIVGLVILCLVALRHLSLTTHHFVRRKHGFFSTAAAIDRATFLEIATQVEYGELFSYYPIARTCAARDWREGLVFSCEHVRGPVEAVRNQILTCARYAIEAGAALVVPNSTVQHVLKKGALAEKVAPLDSLLDRSEFMARLSSACPGLLVADRLQDLDYFASIKTTLELIPRDLETMPLRQTGLQHPQSWRESFDDWLVAREARVTDTAAVHIKLGQAFCEFPIQHDGPEFAKNFGKLLSFTPKARYLAAAALWELKSRSELDLWPDQLINDGGYYAVHVPLDRDGAWPPKGRAAARASALEQELLDDLRRSGARVVYVAADERGAARRFAERARAAVPNITAAVTKHDLLRGGDVGALAHLAAEQQAVVDFLMLLKATRFAGAGRSGFAWNVALRRREMSLNVTSKRIKPEGSRRALEDENSVLFGLEGAGDRVTEYHTMWP